MEIANAYALVGSYRGAAALCGTTHKTVERVVNGGDGAGRKPHQVVRKTAVVEALIPTALGTATRAAVPRPFEVSRAASFG